MCTITVGLIFLLHCNKQYKQQYSILALTIQSDLACGSFQEHVFWKIDCLVLLKTPSVLQTIDNNVLNFDKNKLQNPYEQ